jgi:hypothetical protein
MLASKVSSRSRLARGVRWLEGRAARAIDAIEVAAPALRSSLAARYPEPGFGLPFTKVPHCSH